MSLGKVKAIFLGDEGVFEFVNSKTSWTKEFYTKINTNNPIDIPIYTATKEPVAFVKEDHASLIQADHKNPVISFGANGDGSAGTNLVLHQKPFYISNDRTCLRIKDEKIIPEFIYFKLQNIKSQYGFDFQFKATPKNIKTLVEVSVPINKNGEFDAEEQKKFIERYKKYSAFTEGLQSHIDYLESNRIAFNIVNKKTINLSLADKRYFSLSIGNRILKKDIKKHGVPVYSANVLVPFGCVEKTDFTDFSRPALLWGIDGNFDWGLMPAGKPFAATDHCGTLYVEHEGLDSKYVYYALKSSKEQYGFDRTYRSSLANMKDVVTVDVPVKENGEFDITAQKEMAQHYERLELMKGSLSDQLYALSSVLITIE